MSTQNEGVNRYIHFFSPTVTIRVLRAAVQFDHVTLFFFNILWCTYELTSSSVMTVHTVGYIPLGTTRVMARLGSGHYLRQGGRWKKGGHKI